MTKSDIAQRLIVALDVDGYDKAAALVESLAPHVGYFKIGSVLFTQDCPQVVEFVAGGALDPAVHSGPVTVGLEFADGRREDILVGIYGTVE